MDRRFITLTLWVFIVVWCLGSVLIMALARMEVLQNPRAFATLNLFLCTAFSMLVAHQVRYLTWTHSFTDMLVGNIRAGMYAYREEFDGRLSFSVARYEVESEDYKWSTSFSLIDGALCFLHNNGLLDQVLNEEFLRSIDDRRAFLSMIMIHIHLASHIVEKDGIGVPISFHRLFKRCEKILNE